MLKNILLGLVIIIALPLLVALFVPAQYHSERAVLINQDKYTVYNYLLSLKNQDKFSKWAQMDPNMQKTYSGTDGTVGFISAWSSDDPEVGKGEQEIKAIIPGERIDYELRFIEPFNSVAPAYITTSTDISGKTKVTWAFDGKMDYPMNLMLLFMDMEQLIGDDLQTGLDNLKVILEQPSPAVMATEG